MIISNMNEERRNKYISYISSHYNGVWQKCTRGRVVYPVIEIGSVEEIFGITIDPTNVPHRIMKPSGYEEHCDIQGMYCDDKQLEAIEFAYKLRDRKASRDLLVARDLLLYNNNLLDVLRIWLEDMYNTVQLHNEFCEALQIYCTTNQPYEQVSIIGNDFNIDVNQQHGISYKELMDFAHYGGQKPAIRFKTSLGGRKMKGLITPNDYELQYGETSYNIRISNIQFS